MEYRNSVDLPFNIFQKNVVTLFYVKQKNSIIVSIEFIYD